MNSGQGTARTLKVPVIDSLPLLRISAHAHLIEHVGRQADHGEVVNNEDGSEVDGLPVFHQAGSKPDHTEVEKEDESHGNWGIDQQPGVCPLVWNRERTLSRSHFKALFRNYYMRLERQGVTMCHPTTEFKRTRLHFIQSQQHITPRTQDVFGMMF